VEADALVPLFRLVTGKLPVTCVAKSTDTVVLDALVICP
jgi:hypothetical protein